MKNTLLYPMALISLVPPMTGCSSNKAPENKERPNILFLVSEDNGREIGCYGAPVETPVLDSLAAHGTLFENSYVPQAGSSPSRACFLTGLYPHQNGQIGLATWEYGMYNPETPNIYSSLKKAGYRTGMIGKLHVNPESAFPIDDHMIPSANFKREKLHEYAEQALEFINKSDQPFYLQVNYPDAHYQWLKQVDGLPEHPLNGEEVVTIPFAGIENEHVREEIANYYNCIMRMDHLVGDLLQGLKESGKLENTFIVYIGDHGSQFFRGKTTCYEGGTCIPMIACWPGHSEKNHRYEGLVSTLDLYPTFMELAGLEIPDYLPGKSLKKIVTEGNDEPVREYLYTQYNVHSNHNPNPQRTIRDGRYKLIWTILAPEYNLSYDRIIRGFYSFEELNEMLDRAPEEVRHAYKRMAYPHEFELYDLQNDPYEWHDLAEDPAYYDILNQLKEQLHEWQLETKDPFIDKAVAKRFFDHVIELGLHHEVAHFYDSYMDPKMNFE